MDMSSITNVLEMFSKDVLGGSCMMNVVKRKSQAQVSDLIYLFI